MKKELPLLIVKLLFPWFQTSTLRATPLNMLLKTRAPSAVTLPLKLMSPAPLA